MAKPQYPYLQAIPSLLRRRRKRMRLSQKDLAEDSHLSKRVIENAESLSYSEAGKSINLISFLQILQALKVRVRFVGVDTGCDLNGRHRHITGDQAEKFMDKEDEPARPELERCF